MEPFSNNVWICILLAYAGVNTVLFLVARFSPYEWHQKGDSPKLENDFTLKNTFFFCLAACMQQGVDIAPKYLN